MKKLKIVWCDIYVNSRQNNALNCRFCHGKFLRIESSALQHVLVKLKMMIISPTKQNSVQTTAWVKYQVLISKTKEEF